MPADPAAWQRWLTEEVAPFWVRRVVAPQGYIEYLTPEGEPAPRAGQNPLVTARLIYCFSQLHLLAPGRALSKRPARIPISDRALLGSG